MIKDLRDKKGIQGEEEFLEKLVLLVNQDNLAVFVKLLNFLSISSILLYLLTEIRQ